MNQLPCDLFSNYVVYYLPFKIARSICKLKTNIKTDIEERALKKLFSKLRNKSNDEILNIGMNNKFLFTLYKPEFQITKIVKTIFLTSNVSIYLESFFNITKSKFFDMIREIMGEKYGNGMYLTNDQIMNEIGVFICVTDVLKKLRISI